MLAIRDEVHVGGDVATHAYRRLSGHSGETSRSITLPFVVVVTFEDGLLLGERFQYDLTSLQRQLGRDRLPELASLPHRAAGGYDPGRQGLPSHSHRLD